MKNIENTACACTIVLYDPIRNENGTYSTRWICASCRTEFKKVKTMEKDMKKASAIWYEEVIHKADVRCPNCNRPLLADEVISKSMIPGTRITNQKTECPYCEKTFLLNIYI